MSNNKEHKACKETYIVKAGDTLYSISEKYNIPVRLLMSANKITNPYNLRIGHALCIPRYTNNPYNPYKPSKAPTSTCPKTTYYTVTEGDSFYLIAKKHRVSLNELIDANPDIDPYNLIIGTKLRIPSNIRT